MVSVIIVSDTLCLSLCSCTCMLETKPDFSSRMALSFGKVEPMVYSPYLHQCLQHLEQEGEYDFDLNLVYLVRVQYLSQRIAHCSSHEAQLPGMPVTPEFFAPRDLYIAALQTELDQMRENLPLRLQTDSESDPRSDSNE